MLLAVTTINFIRYHHCEISNGGCRAHNRKVSGAALRRLYLALGYILQAGYNFHRLRDLEQYTVDFICIRSMSRSFCGERELREQDSSSKVFSLKVLNADIFKFKFMIFCMIFTFVLNLRQML